MPVATDGADQTDVVDPPPESELLRLCNVGDVVATPAGRVVVVLSSSATPRTAERVQLADTIDVHGPDGLTSRPADELVIPVRESRHRVKPLKNAVAALEHRHRTDLDAITALRTGHTEELGEIRTYAIQRHLDREICRQGLNAFLTQFGLGAYQPRLRVAFTLTGSYEVDDEDGDIDAATSQARTFLRADLDDIDRVIPDSECLTVRIDDVAALDC